MLRVQLLHVMFDKGRGEGSLSGEEISESLVEINGTTTLGEAKANGVEVQIEPVCCVTGYRNMVGL